MADTEAPISILEQRRIEAAIIKPIYELLVRDIGKARAQAIIGEAIRDAAIAAGRGFAAREEKGTSLASFAALFPLWAKGDAYDMEVLASTEERFEFNIKRCGYAEMYREMGVGEIGHLLSCQRDGLFCTGYDPRIKMTRTQTIMQGASHCDFRYEFSPVRNLGDMLDPRRDPEKVVLIDVRDGKDARSWTARALDELFDAVARGLLARGLKRGDSVGILALNRVEFVAVYFGAMRAGLVAVPINWKLPSETVAYIAGDAGVKLFFADAERMAVLPAGVPVIGFDAPEWASFLDPGPFESVTPAADEVAQILYTSGSTGRPKGVPLSHAGQRWAVEAVSGEDVSAHRLLVAAPMFHMNALFNLKFAFHNDACVVLLPNFSVPSYLAAMEAHRVTWLTSVPTMLAMLAKEVGGRPPDFFGDVTKVFMGSSPFGQTLLDRVRSLFPNATVTNGYGTTEAGPAVFGKHPGGLPTPDLSMGYPLPGVGLRIVDERGEPIEGPGEGVLQMRTPALMAGYLHLPEVTARVLRDGWYHSNDLVRRDADGFYFFIGRADDMFVSGGENVYPGEVEKMLERHPAVQQAVVVAVPDEVKQTLPFAFVVLRPGAAPDEADIKAWALKNGPAYQHPRWVEFIDAMPLAGTNKVDRAALKERAREIASTRGR